MIFWGALGLMVIGGLAMVVLPALRMRADERMDAATADQVRRIDEFTADLAAGDIDPEISAALRDELERAVIDAVPVADPEPSAGAKRVTPRFFAACLVVPLVAISVYLHTGSPQIAEFEAAHPGLTLAMPEASVEILLEELRERVRDAPDDREAWMVLIRSNMQLGRYVEAVSAAEHLYRLAPRDPPVILALIDALAMSQGGRIGGRAVELISDVLTLDPNNATAQILKGILEQEAGDGASAMAWWLRALDQTAPDSPLREELVRMIDSARGEVTPAAAPAAAPQAHATARLMISVSLDESLTARTRPEDTVFVIARAVDGPKIPLAVSRHTRAQLPLTISLDDTMAMVPGMSITDFEKVYVVARISAAGSPQAHSGDLEGRSAEITVAEVVETVVLIDSVVP